MTPSSDRHPQDALLVLEDGSIFPGHAVAPGTRFGEVVFNTSMTGYQEIVTEGGRRALRAGPVARGPDRAGDGTREDPGEGLPRGALGCP